jgi:hypothetical protein
MWSDRGDQFGVAVPLVHQAAVDCLLTPGCQLDSFFFFTVSDAPCAQLDSYIFTRPILFM